MLTLVTRRRGLAPKEVFGYHAYPLMVHALHVSAYASCIRAAVYYVPVMLLTPCT